MYQSSSLNDPVILVVDTDPESLSSVAALLIAQDHQVHTASDATAAIEIARSHPLDLLITDVRLHDWTGAELLAAIRQSPDRSDLPVMYLSTHQRPGVIRRTHGNEAAFHLKKTAAPDVLLELVGNALWMPHLVSSHLQQQTINPPHIEFAKNPFAIPVDERSAIPIPQFPTPGFDFPSLV